MDETQAIECHYCHKAVEPQDALPIALESDVYPYDEEVIVVFHRPPALCAPQYSLEKLVDANLKIQEALKNFIEAAKKADEQDGQL